jgi:hypothetical protein
MSYWTHVNGIMRFDSDVDRDKEMKKMCRTADWDSGRTVKKRCNVPMGSEGSLDVSLVVKKSNIGQSRKYTLSFFGDLRDYPQKKEKDIMKWLTNLIKEHDLIVRDAVVTVNEVTYRHYVNVGFQKIHEGAR